MDFYELFSIIRVCSGQSGKTVKDALTLLRAWLASKGWALPDRLDKLMSQLTDAASLLSTLSELP